MIDINNAEYEFNSFIVFLFLFLRRFYLDNKHREFLMLIIFVHN